MGPSHEFQMEIVRAVKACGSLQVEPDHDAYDAIMQRFHDAHPDASAEEYFAVKCAAARITGALVSLGKKPE